MDHLFLNLHAFDGDGGAAAAGTGNAGAGAEGSPDAAGNRAESIFTDSTGQPDAAAAGTDFESYMQTHKDEADKWFSDRFQKTFNRKFRDYKSLQGRVKADSGIMEMLATKYGIEDANDVQAIAKALENDDALYAERAEANGRTIDEQRNWDMLERENRQYRAQQKQAERAMQIQRQMDQWDKESQNLKQLFPDFDLDRELQNPDFEAALRGGLSMQRAFYAVHGDEIFSGAMQNTAQAVRNATVEDMASRRQRPRENAIGAQASAKVAKDVHRLSKQERAEIARKSMTGIIRF